MSARAADKAALRTLVRQGQWNVLKAINLTRYEIRSVVMPEVRVKLGEVAQVRERFSTNWGGSGLMSRYAIWLRLSPWTFADVLRVEARLALR